MPYIATPVAVLESGWISEPPFVSLGMVITAKKKGARVKQYLGGPPGEGIWIGDIVAPGTGTYNFNWPAPVIFRLGLWVELDNDTEGVEVFIQQVN